jgi:hypothetical protein
MAIFGSDVGARPSRTIRAFAVLASLWSVGCVWLASAEFRGFMAQTNPRAYAAAAHLLDYPGLWASRATGAQFGPMDLAIRAPGPGENADCVLLASGRVQRLNQLVLSPAGGGRFTLRLVENEHRVLSSPPLDAHDGVIRARVAAPWLYPPAASPYWDGVEPALRGGLQTLFSIAWDGGSVSVHSPHSADPVGFEPAVRRSPERPGGPYVEGIAHAAQAGR